jgi:ABC-type transporter Mla subunit MlaD
MTEGRGAFLRVGLLILGGIAALVGLVLFLAGAGLRGSEQFETYFGESVQGLDVGTPIKYRGVTIGRVSDIGLTAAEYGAAGALEAQGQIYRLVFVRYVIDPAKIGKLPDIAEAIRSGLRARLASQGITGLSYIELDFVNPVLYPPEQVPWHPKVTYIPSVPSTYTQVRDAAQEFLGRLNKVDIEALSSSIIGLVGDVRQELKTGDTHTALVQATALLATLQQAIQAADLPGMTADLKQTSAAARGVIQGKDVHALLASASAAAARLPALIAALDATARRTDASAADVQRDLVPLLRDLSATAANLRETTDALRQYPAGVLLGGPPPREKEPAR